MKQLFYYIKKNRNKIQCRIKSIY